MADDTPPIWLKRSLGGFEPLSEIDRESISRWGLGSVVRARLSKPRSGKQQRYYWAILRAVHHHQEKYETVEALHLALKVRFGLVKEMVVPVGEGMDAVVIVPLSTDYDSMEAGAFNQHVDRTMQLVWAEIIPGLDAAGRKALLQDIDKMAT